MIFSENRCPLFGIMLYRPESFAATDLIRLHEGPDLACTAPSTPGTKASPREAYGGLGGHRLSGRAEQ